MWIVSTSFIGNRDTKNIIALASLRQFQKTPGTYPRYPKMQIWKDFLHKQMVGGLGAMFLSGSVGIFLEWSLAEVPDTTNLYTNLGIILALVKRC